MFKRSLPKNLNRITDYLIPNAKQVFTQLWQAFTKVLIFQHFNLEYNIWIKINVLGYAIKFMLN